MAKSTWWIRCQFKGCMFARDGIALKSDAKRHAAAHTGVGGALHVVAVFEKESLSNTVRVGDRIRIKESRRREYQEACKAAGYDADVDAVHLVKRIDPFGTGGRSRLFVEAPPFAFYPSDVELVWNSDEERRKGLGL